MGATTGLARQEDGFDKLLKLANLKAGDIQAAGEENRRQIQLTEAEQAKVKEARDYIVKHTSLAADIQRREDELMAGKVTHAKDKEDFAKYVAAENARLENFSKTLDERDKTTASNAAKAEQAVRGAATLKADYTREHQTAMSNVKIAENTNIEIGRKLVAEQQRLADWEATLKAKAERIRQQVANF